MFMLFMWLMVCIGGNVVQGGQMEFVHTSLTSAVTATDNVLHVKSTEGFPDAGTIAVEAEHVLYSRKSDTSFYGVAVVRPLVRGAGDTEAVAHEVGAGVTTVPGELLAGTQQYNMALLSDASGTVAFITQPIAVLSSLGTFFTLPLSYLGTDMQILSYLWIILVAGMIVALSLNMLGSRIP